MTVIKRLAGQTAVYGISGILGRILGYLLVPLYTRIFVPEEYGTVSVFYSYAAFLMVILTYGMETAFFRFHQQEKDKEKVYSTGMISLLLTSILFLLLINVNSGSIAGLIDYPDKGNYILWFGWILALDAISSMPFARLRAQNKARRFAVIKLSGIFINIGLNLFFILLCPFLLINSGENIRVAIQLIYNPRWGIEYIFISNLISSGIVLLLLLPEILSTRWKLHPELWKKMIFYAFPLLFAGMAGVINETFDRLLLKYLLPPDIADYQVGIYSACYKISILMTIFIQAYKYAAEPFFFAQAKEKDAAETYAHIMNYFVITVSLIFLGTMVYLDDIIMPFLIDEQYWEGRAVIPVLMLANLFLGIYYNLSIWYKLTGKTMWGAWLSAAGAAITLSLNFWWIPRSADHILSGYYGSAWATFICYGAMMVLSYFIGQKFLPVKYNLKKFFGYTGLSVLLYFVSIIVQINRFIPAFLFHTLLIIVFVAIIASIEKPVLIRTFLRRLTRR